MLVCAVCGRKYPPQVGLKVCPLDKSELVLGTGLDPRINSMVGNYQIKRLLGRGAMGAVYQAEHILIGKQVAIKVIHSEYASEQDLIQRFLREACAVARIGHPNIVDVLDFGQLRDGSTYLMMEYVDGELLADIVDRQGPMPLHRAIPIVQQLAAALGAAHRQNIVHRDVKPTNVIIQRRTGPRQMVRIVDPSSRPPAPVFGSATGAGAGSAAGSGSNSADADDEPHLELSIEETFDFVKLCDFGVAKMLDVETRALTRMGTVIGTPEYMAPEALQGDAPSPQIDVYALAVLFYELLTGRVPFKGTSHVEVLKRVLTEPAPPLAVANPLAEYTDAAERLILRCLAKEPGRRPQSMDVFAHELLQCYGPVTYRRYLREQIADDPNWVLEPPVGMTASLEQEVEAIIGQLNPEVTPPPQRARPVDTKAAVADGASGPGQGSDERGGGDGAPAGEPPRPGKQGSFRSLFQNLKRRLGGGNGSSKPS